MVMDIKRDDCGMSESIGGVSRNLRAILQNMFLSNRNQSEAPVETLQMRGKNNKTKQTGLAYNIYHILPWNTQALTLFGKRLHESLYSSLKRCLKCSNAGDHQQTDMKKSTQYLKKTSSPL